MTTTVITGFAELVTAFAGLAIGLSLLIVAKFWVVFRHTSNGARLLPIHVMLIGTSYSMLGFVAVARLGDPPSAEAATFWSWWIYPFSTLAFLLGDIALLLILRFISRRGARYGRRATDLETWS